MRTPGKDFRLDQARALKALSPDPNPYFAAPLARGQHVGYRKPVSGQSTWIARLTVERKPTSKSLGLHTDAFGWDQAKAAALTWFAAKADGSADRPRAHRISNTVTQGCEAYIDNMVTDNLLAKAADARFKLAKNVMQRPIGNIQLERLEVSDFNAWKKSLGLKAGNYNRILRSFRAALNWAAANGMVSREYKPVLESLLRDVQPMPQLETEEQSNRREVMLDARQRKALIAQCGNSGFRDFVLGAILTGARGGELAKAKVGHLNIKQRTIKLIGKTKERTVPLSSASVKALQEIAGGREPEELLFECNERWDNRLKTRVEVSPFIEHLPEDGNEPVVEARMWKSSEWGKMFALAVAQARAAAKARGEDPEQAMPKKTVHYSLRHCWITEMLEAEGMTLAEVARLTGTSITMIDKHYHHLKEDEVRVKMDSVKLI